MRDVVHRWDNNVCPVMQEAVRSDQVDVDFMETQRSWCVAPNGPGVPTQILEPLHANEHFRAQNLPHYFTAPKSFAIPFVECMISRHGKKLDHSRALRDCRRSPSGRVVKSCNVGGIPAA